MNKFSGILFLSIAIFTHSLHAGQCSAWRTTKIETRKVVQTGIPIAYLESYHDNHLTQLEETKFAVSGFSDYETLVRGKVVGTVVACPTSSRIIYTYPHPNNQDFRMTVVLDPSRFRCTVTEKIHNYIYVNGHDRMEGYLGAVTADSLNGATGVRSTIRYESRTCQ